LYSIGKNSLNAGEGYKVSRDIKFYPYIKKGLKIILTGRLSPY
jgi:hypothetical protein